jgi:lysophospholipase L1-like esterase
MDQPIVPASAPRRNVRELLIAIGLTSAILLLVGGGSIRSTGEEMRPGLLRDFVLAVGKPAGWLDDRLPLDDAVHDITAFLSPDEDLGGGGGGRFSGPRVAAGTGIPPVSAEAFDRAALGETPHPTTRLHKLLVTGDSLSMPLDADLARTLADDGVKTAREAHVGTGLSKSELLDWGKLSVRQARREKPDAVDVFIGANEGFDMTTPAGVRVTCCGIDWAVEYATRARSMMSVYRRAGKAQVYWLTVPTPRGERAIVARAVNEALEVAAAPYRADVHVVDLVQTFTPGNRYRDAMTVGDRRRVVRESDGIHLNELGSEIAAGIVLGALRRDFVIGG